ncbi:DMT family transporter [Flavihumibacter profundi]|nr:DMT family transporter [Flavihumibacter profundi]
MLLAAAGFSLMGASAKMVKETFSAGQLVFWRNMMGALVLVPGLILRPPQKKTGGKIGWLVFRGFMGTVAVYALLYCVINMPLGTAMTYNLTSTIWIALFSFLVFREYAGKPVIIAILLGFAGMVLVYQPNIHMPWYFHFAGFISGICSGIAYLTVGRLSSFFDARLIVLSFVSGGIIIPLLSTCIQYYSGLPADGVWLIKWQWPVGGQWIWIIGMGLFALFGQYFVTRAYGSDKASVVSAISYANIVFSVFLGVLMGDHFPDIISLAGILCIICSGIMISVFKERSKRGGI